MTCLTIYQKMVQAVTMQQLSENLVSISNTQINTEYNVFKFHKCEQMADEAIDAYCTRLRELAASCKFHDTFREIKTQIVRKCNSRKLRLRALSEEMTLDSLLKHNISGTVSKTGRRDRESSF